MGTQMDLVAERRDGSEVMVEIALSPLQDHGLPYVVAAIRAVATSASASSRSRVMIMKPSTMPSELTRKSTISARRTATVQKGMTLSVTIS